MTKFEQLSARMVADLIRDYKLKAFQAAAFPGNAGEESGGFTKLQEQNPKSGRGGLGFFQDTGPRRVAFEQWIARNADKNYSAGDYAANYSFLVRELDGPENHVLAPLHASTTIEEATEIVMKVFERPYLPTAHLEVRIDYARKALAAFLATGQSEDELRARGRPEATTGQEVLEPLPHAPGTTEVIPIHKSTSIDFNQIMAVIHRIVNEPIVREFAAPILASKGIILPQLSPASIEPSKPVVIKPAPSRLDRPGVQLGVASFFTGLVAQLTGAVGPPQGLDSIVNLVTSPTVAGTLTTVLPIALAALSATGAPGAMAAGVLKIVSPMVMSAAEAKKKRETP